MWWLWIPACCRCAPSWIGTLIFFLKSAPVITTLGVQAAIFTDGHDSPPPHSLFLSAWVSIVSLASLCGFFSTVLLLALPLLMHKRLLLVSVPNKQTEKGVIPSPSPHECRSERSHFYQLVRGRLSSQRSGRTSIVSPLFPIEPRIT